jgi:hypothetical protein
MTENIFMSYSRRELGFVDDLVGNLEARKYNVWLDYRVLIPGVPWAEQIEKGLNESDTVLLVVSKASLASEYVAMEWRHFLDTNKRLILLIFEAVDLPKELEKFEWVDFRGSYKSGLAELFSQLEKPIQEDHPVPESGFKAPWFIWGVIALSVVVALISLGAFWSIFVPWFLIPLPYKIYKRSFDFMRVQAALLALPVALTLAAFVYTDPTPDLIEGLAIGFGTGIFGWILLYVLRTPAMQRWGKPESTVPKFANPYKPNIDTPDPVPFYVDYAEEDRAIAKELTAVLQKHGHPQAENLQSAKAVFVLMSQFKLDTEAHPDKQVVFPVMIQGDGNIPKKLSRIQWIDFRPGVRGLDAIAQLLPNPKEMLKALGVRPVSSLSVHPPMITALYYFIILITVINVGAVVDYLFLSGILDFVPEEMKLPAIAAFVIGLLVLCILAYFMVGGLISRKGLFSRFPFILAGIVLQGVLMFGMIELDNFILQPAMESGFDPEEISLSFTNFGDNIYFLGLLVLIFVFLRNRKDIRRWFPSRKKG